MKARLYLDEDLDPALARLLRSWNEDVISVHEVGTTGLTDEEQLERATAEGRAIVTCNYGDFQRLAKRWADDGRDHAGVIISYRQYRRSQVAVIARAIVRLLDTIDAETLANSLQILDQFREDA